MAAIPKMYYTQRVLYMCPRYISYSVICFFSVKWFSIYSVLLSFFWSSGFLFLRSSEFGLMYQLVIIRINNTKFMLRLVICKYLLILLATLVAISLGKTKHQCTKIPKSKYQICKKFLESFCLNYNCLILRQDRERIIIKLTFLTIAVLVVPP